MPALNRLTVPEEAWDAHMHVTDLERFPPPRKQVSTYSASNITLSEAKRHAKTLSLPRMVFIQPSTYGTDNSCVLWCLRQQGPKNGRAVVAINPSNIDRKTLLEWHELGVRGVRINLKAVDARLSYDELDTLIRSVDNAIRDLPSWGIHFYVDLTVIPVLRSIVGTLSSTRKICIDHMASPTPDLTHSPVRRELEEWSAFRDLLERPNVFVKISAPYRIVQSPLWWPELEGLVKELLTIRGGDAAVFASDWPHTRFAGMDVKPWKDLCLQWCDTDDELKEKLFVANAKRLYDVN